MQKLTGDLAFDRGRCDGLIESRIVSIDALCQPPGREHREHGRRVYQLVNTLRYRTSRCSVYCNDLGGPVERQKHMWWPITMLGFPQFIDRAPDLRMRRTPLFQRRARPMSAGSGSWSFHDAITPHPWGG